MSLINTFVLRYACEIMGVLAYAWVTLYVRACVGLIQHRFRIAGEARLRIFYLPFCLNTKSAIILFASCRLESPAAAYFPSCSQDEGHSRDVMKTTDDRFSTTKKCVR